MRTRRALTGLFASAAGTGITLLASFAFVVALLLLLSRTPLETVRYFFVGAFANRYSLGNMLNSAVPLIFRGLGISIAFTSGVFNLGG